ncbi:MAG: DUF4105 domain-containing protein [Gemmatimonadales bacterium]
MSRGRRVALLLGLLGAWPAGAAKAQLSSADPAPGHPAAAPQISLVTIGPGPILWEKFGHNMIRVTDSAAGTDIAYNFGIFDFRQKNFYWNFLQGRMLYSMAGYIATRDIQRYVNAGRSVEVQDLALTADQARTLAANLARNALPDMKDYRYQPFRDNCSTRVRDALNVSLGGALEAALAGVPANATFRSRTAELTAGSPAWYFGLMLLLGPSTDQPLSAWEDAFIPGNLARYVEPAINPALDGGTAPLVDAVRLQPATADMGPSTHTPPFWLGWFLVLGVLLGGLLAWSGGRDGAGRGRRPFLVLAGIWSLLSGLAGLVIIYLWAFTDHTYAYRNENVLQASVLGLAMFGVLAAWARRDGPAPAALRNLAVTVAVLSVLGVFIQVLPWFPQVNAPILVFFVPANLGMALGAMRAVPTLPTTTGPSATRP